MCYRITDDTCGSRRRLHYFAVPRLREGRRAEIVLAPLDRHNYATNKTKKRARFGNDCDGHELDADGEAGCLQIVDDVLAGVMQIHQIFR